MAAYDDALISLRADLSQLRSDTRQIKTLMEQAFATAPVDKFNASIGKMNGILGGLRQVVKTVAGSFADVRVEMEKTAQAAATTSQRQAQASKAVIAANNERGLGQQKLQREVARTGVIEQQAATQAARAQLIVIQQQNARMAGLLALQRAEQQQAANAAKIASQAQRWQRSLMGTRVRIAGRAVNRADSYYATQDRQLNNYAKTLNQAAIAMSNFSTAEDRALKNRYNQNRNLFNSTANASDKSRMDQILTGGGNDQGLLQNAGGMTRSSQAKELSQIERARLQILQEQGVHIQAQTGFMSNLIQRTGVHILQWGGLLASMEAINLVIETITGNMTEMISKGSEFQKEAILFSTYQGALRTGGHQTDQSTSNDMLSQAINLAHVYGDEVNNVAQDIDLWYKRTGDLNSATALTNETMKFQLATGSQLEDTYRTLTGLAGQAGKIPMDRMQSGNQTFGLNKTKIFLQEITAAAIAAGAGLHQVNEGGEELGGRTNNSASILLRSLDKDAAALGSLGYDMTHIIAINASLIQSFGNDGAAAEEAAEKIGRLSGGLAAFSKPATSSIKDLAAKGIDLKGIFNTTPTGGQLDIGILEKLSAVYEKLTPEAQKELAVTIAGTRQYESLQAILVGLVNTKKVLNEMTKNMNAEDKLAAEMSGTYDLSVKRLNATWEGFLIVVGQGVLPMMAQFVNYLANVVVPSTAAAVDRLATLFRGMGADAQVALGAMQIAGAYRDLQGAKLNAQFHPFGGGSTDVAAKQKAYDDLVKSIAHADQVGTNAQRHLDRLDTGPSTGQGGHYDQAHRQFVFDRNAGVQHFANDDVRYNYYHGINSPLSTLQNLGGKNLMNVGNIAAEIKDLYSTAGAPEKTGNLLNTAGAAAGAASGPATQKELQKELDDEYKDQLEHLKELVKMDDERIKQAERHVRIEGATTANVAAERSAYHAKANDERNQAAFIAQHIKTLAPEASKDLTLAKAAGGANTKAGIAFMGDYRAIMAEIRSSHGDWQALIDDIQDLGDKWKEAGAAGVTFSVGQISTGATTAAAPLQGRVTSDNDAISATQSIADKYRAIRDEAAATEGLVAIWATSAAEIRNTSGATAADIAKAAEFSKQAADATAAQAKAQAEVDKYARDSAKSLREALTDVSTQIGEALGKSLGAPSWMQSYREEIAKIGKEAEQAAEKVQDFARIFGANNSQVQQLQAEDALWLKVEQDIADYNERVAAIKDSDIFQATEAGLNALVAGLESDAFKNLFNVTGQENAITATKDYINALEQQKEVINTTYDESRWHSAMDNANRALALYLLDQQIKKEKEYQQAQQWKAEHPSLLVAAAQDFTKNAFQNILKQFTSGTMANLFNLKPDAKLTADYQAYQSATTLFGIKVDAFVQAVTNKMPGGAGPAGAYPAGTEPSQMNAQDANTTMMDMMFGPGYNSSSPMGGALYGSDYSAGGDSMATALGVSLTGPTPGGSTVAGNSILSNALGGGLQSFVGTAASALGLFNMGVGGSGGSQGLKTFGTLTSMLGQGVGSFGSSMAAVGAQQGNATEVSQGQGLQQAGQWAGAGGNIISSFGTSTDSGIGSVIGGGAGAFLGSIIPGIGTALGATLGSALGGAIGGLFGPHINNTNNPDMYANNGFAQAWANINGVAGTAANGTVQENPLVSQELGGQSEMQYLDQWVNQHPGGAGLSGASLSEWQQVYKLTQGGTATGISGLHNGQMGVEGAQGQTMTQNWQSLQTTIQDTTQAVLTFQNALNATPEALVSLNMFGSSGGFFPYAWNTPGYQFPAGGAGVGNYGTNPTAGGTNGSPNPTAPGAATNGTPGYNGVTTVPYGANANAYSTPNTAASSQAIQVKLTIPVDLDGRQIAISTQAYLLRAQGAGYNYVQ